MSPRVIGIMLILISLLSVPILADNGKIAFQSNPAEDYVMEIFVMNADGSDLTRITNNAFNDAQPVFSRDGTKIVFVSDRDGNLEIYSMNADGSAQTRLTDDPALDGTPSWSPDGSKISFASYRDGDGWSEIFVMNADGSGVVQLTDSDGGDEHPSWSPDGEKIVFQSGRDGNWEIYVMNADGTGQTRLTNEEEFDQKPVWSPDGTKIAFESARDPPAIPSPNLLPNWEIYVMNADGSSPTRLTFNDAEDREAAWSPGGKKIAFYSDRDGDSEIFIMNADDGSDLQQLTFRDTSADEHPSFGGSTITPVPEFPALMVPMGLTIALLAIVLVIRKKF